MTPPNGSRRWRAAGAAGVALVAVLALVTVPAPAVLGAPGNPRPPVDSAVPDEGEVPHRDDTGTDDTVSDDTVTDDGRTEEQAEPLPPAPIPAVPDDLPSAVDPLPSYQGQYICSPEGKPGTEKFATLIRETYGYFARSVWIPRDCSIGGRSEHKEGRALDWMINRRDREQRHIAESFLEWLLAPDANGQPFAMARRLGVMYIGWDDRIWESYTQRWSELKGCFSTPQTSLDTYCHRDHIHISLSWDGAAGQTSFWGGDPTPAPFCDRYATASTTPSGVGVGLEFVPIAPRRILDTSRGRGTRGDAPCRMAAKSSGGPGAPIVLNVRDRPASPGADVAAVAVRITTRGSNSPASLRSLTSGSIISDILVNAPRETVTILPVADDGTVALTTDSGATHLVVDLLGYFVQPQPVPHDGLLLAHPGIVVVDTTLDDSPLAPRERRVIDVGLDSSSAGPPAGALLAVTATGVKRGGYLAVLQSGEERRTRASSAVLYRRGVSAGGTALVGLDAEGRITLVNQGKGPVHVTVALQASAVRGSIGGSRLVVVAPREIVRERTRLFPRLRKSGVEATAAVIQVRATSGRKAGTLSFWSLAEPITPSLSVAPRSTVSALVIVPLGGDGVLRQSFAGGDLDVSAAVVGYLR